MIQSYRRQQIHTHTHTHTHNVNNNKKKQTTRHLNSWRYIQRKWIKRSNDGDGDKTPNKMTPNSPWNSIDLLTRHHWFDLGRSGWTCDLCPQGQDVCCCCWGYRGRPWTNQNTHIHKQSRRKRNIRQKHTIVRSKYFGHNYIRQRTFVLKSVDPSGKEIQWTGYIHFVVKKWASKYWIQHLISSANLH